MAPVGTDGVAMQQGPDKNSRRVVWSERAPKMVASEDSMDPRKVAAVWQKMYNEARMGGMSEAEQQAFRLGVYVYACKNGTSREGDYSGSIVLNNGAEFSAAVIPRATGKMSIRKFFRGCALESYEALKESGCMEADERFVAKVSALGVTPECAFATADWLTDCPKFTPAERAAHDKTFTMGIERARRARDGSTLESVEGGRVARTLEAQGPATAPLAGHEVRF